VGILKDILSMIQPKTSPLARWQNGTPPSVTGNPLGDEDQDPNDADDQTPLPRIKIPDDEQTNPVTWQTKLPPVSVDTQSTDPSKASGEAGMAPTEDVPTPLVPHPFPTNLIPQVQGRAQTPVPMPSLNQNEYSTKAPITIPVPALNPNQQTDSKQRPTRLPVYRNRLEEAINARNQLNTVNPRDLDRNPDSKLTNIGKAIALNLPNLQQALLNPNLTDREAFMTTLGSLIGSTVSGLVNPYGDERQQLEYQKSQAEKDVTEAQGMYDKNLANELGEARVDDIYTKQDERERRLDQRDVDLKNKKFDFATRRMNAYTNLLKTGQLDAKDNQELVDSMSDLVDAKIVLNGFNPAKDKIVGVKVVADAQNNRAYLVTTNAGGVVKTDYVRDENGNIAYIKDPRVKAEEIRSQTSLETTKQRIMSSEKLKAMEITSREKLAQMGITQKEIDGVQDDFYIEYKATDEDAVIERSAKKAGKDPQTLTQDERDVILESYYDTVRERIAKNRGLKTKGTK